MFGSSRSIRQIVRVVERRLATLRVYHHAPRPLGGIYQETAVGAYRPATGSEVVVVTKGGEDGRLHLYGLSPKTGYARHLGCFPELFQKAFEETEPGASFYSRNVQLVRLDRDDIAAAVYAMPVWYAEQRGTNAPAGADKAPRIPTSALLFRHSILDTPSVPKEMAASSASSDDYGYCAGLFDDQDLEPAGSPRP